MNSDGEIQPGAFYEPTHPDNGRIKDDSSHETDRVAGDDMTDTDTTITTTCLTCCYWSELIAKTRSGVLVAMCLAERGPRAWRYTRSSASCAAWEEARDGTIDDPETGHLARARILEAADRDNSTTELSEAQGTHP